MMETLKNEEISYERISLPFNGHLYRYPLQNSESELETGGYTYLTLNKALFH